MALRAPFPYFGGKYKVGAEVWKRFGNPNKYIEPFCGSMAMLLYNEKPVNYETVNDIDGLLTNFWRAIKFAPDDVASLAEAPSSEVDFKARQNWVYDKKDEILESMYKDPKYYNTEAAAYWVYTISTAPVLGRLFSEKIGSRIPKIGAPHGIHAKKRKNQLVENFSELSKRLNQVCIACGDWKRVLSNSSLKSRMSPTAVFLDPPYQEGEYDSTVYEHSKGVFAEVRQWCVDNGDDPDLRIALCGYEGNEMPDTWDEHSWETEGGYGKINIEKRGMKNRTRERIWFSPHCIDPESFDKSIFSSFMEQKS